MGAQDGVTRLASLTTFKLLGTLVHSRGARVGEGSRGGSGGVVGAGSTSGGRGAAGAAAGEGAGEDDEDEAIGCSVER
jgi:hypothetical protein